MAIKTLPSVGSSDWGNPLVGYIGQTKDNTKGGAFKSFDQWSQRPTNLTADDKGLTLLYTRTGNFHEWKGDKWRVNSYGIRTNILDYGDAGSLNGPDLNRDDTAIFDQCLDRAGSRGGSPDGIQYNGSLYLPAGHYRIQSELKNSALIEGDLGQTFIYALKPDEYSFRKNTITCDVSLKNLTFRGDGGPGGLGIKFANGIKVGKDAINPCNQYNVTYENCKIGLFKTWALFSSFYDCKFINNDIGYKAICETVSHTGFDYWRNCTFTGHTDYAFYSDQSAGAFLDENNTVFEHCRFYNNPGTTFYLYRMGIANKSLMFQQCTFDNNATNPGSVEIRMLDSRATMTNCSTPNGITMTGTFCQLRLVGTNIDSIYDKIYMDPDCLIDYKGGETKGLSGDFVDTSKTYNNSNKEFALVRSNNHRGLITRTALNQINFGTMTTLPNVIQAEGGATERIVFGDGLIDNKATKIDFPANSAKWAFQWSTASTVHKKYLFYSFAIKSLDTTKDLKIGLGFDSIIKKEVILKNNIWQTYNGICTNSSLDNFVRLINNTPTGSASILISKFQIVEFDTYQEAHNFFKSDTYALPPINQIVSYDSNIPTNGRATKGDIAYNDNPIVNSPVGWICTAAGTPGTWKSMGNIVSNITTNLPILTTNSAANIITLTYAIDLKITTIPAVSAFTLSGGKTISSITIVGRTINLNLNSPYAIEEGVTISYIPPSAATAIQDNFGNSAIGFSNLYTVAGLLAVDFNVLNPLYKKQTVNQLTSYTRDDFTGNVLTIKYIASTQKLVGDGSIEFEYINLELGSKSIYLSFGTVPTVIGEGDSNNNFGPNAHIRILPDKYSNDTYYANSNLPVSKQTGDKVRIKRLAGVVSFQIKRLNTNIWIEALTYPNPITGTLYPKISTNSLSGYVGTLTIRNVFGSGLS